MDLRFKTLTLKLPAQLEPLKRHWLTIAFLGGFVIDNLTLNRVDQLLDNLVLLSYIIIAGLSLLLLYAATAGKLSEKWTNLCRAYMPLLIQYAFGGLLSGMLIFYGRSGTWIESWPFLLLILGVIIGNEMVRQRSARLRFNLAVFFIGLFAYLVLIIPVLSGYMGPWIFIGSGLLAVGLMYLFLLALYRIIPNFITLQQKPLIFTIGVIYVGFNFLYFANIIPPIPLSLKDIGIYHSVIYFPEANAYQLKHEPGAWWEFWKDADNGTIHIASGEPVYCFAKVFAPTRLNTEIFHRWEYYDQAASTWQTHGRFSYAISGGRGDGYRGYTYIQNHQSGTWRCTVETARGQELGQETFRIDTSAPATDLVTVLE